MVWGQFYLQLRVVAEGIRDCCAQQTRVNSCSVRFCTVGSGLFPSPGVFVLGEGDNPDSSLPFLVLSAAGRIVFSYHPPSHPVWAQPALGSPAFDVLFVYLFIPR